MCLDIFLACAHPNLCRHDLHWWQLGSHPRLQSSFSRKRYEGTSVLMLQVQCAVSKELFWKVVCSPKLMLESFGICIPCTKEPRSDPYCQGALLLLAVKRKATSGQTCLARSRKVLRMGAFAARMLHPRIETPFPSGKTVAPASRTAVVDVRHGQIRCW